MPSTLEPEELGSLMAAIGEAGEVAQGLGPAPVPVDLTNPERNVPEPMPALEAAHERLAAQFGRAVAGRTRRRFRVKPNRIVRVRAEELRDLMSPVSLIAVLDVVGTRHTGLLLLDRSLAEGMLSAGLGLGPAEAVAAEGDEFTSLERRVLRRILSLVERPVADAYRDISRLAVRVSRIEPDPRLADIIDDAEVALLGTFDVEGELEGSFRLALPFSVLEGARRELVHLPQRSPPVPARLLSHMRGAVESVKVDVGVELGEQRLPMSAVAGLRRGDLLTLNTDENTPLAVRVNGMTKLWATPTVSDGSMAVEIVEVAHDLQQPTEIPVGYAPGAADVAVGAALERQGAAPHSGALMTDANAQPDPHAMSAPMAAPPAPALDLDDVQVAIAVRLGRTTLTIGEVLQMQPGGVIKLDKAAGEPLDVLVNGRLIARGEAVVVGDRFGVRLTSVLEKDVMAGGER